MQKKLLGLCGCLIMLLCACAKETSGTELPGEAYGFHDGSVIALPETSLSTVSAASFEPEIIREKDGGYQFVYCLPDGEKLEGHVSLEEFAGDAPNDLLQTVERKKAEYNLGLSDSEALRLILKDLNGLTGDAPVVVRYDASVAEEDKDVKEWLIAEQDGRSDIAKVYVISGNGREYCAAVTGLRPVYMELE